MSSVNKSKSEALKKDESVIYGQTNPSFHDTPEDAKNYKSLQSNINESSKKPMFILKPSILTKKAEEIRTDKATVKSLASTVSVNKFLVFGKDTKIEPIKPSISKEMIKEPTSEFVFGQNIFSRVVASDVTHEIKDSAQEFKDLTSDKVDNPINGSQGTSLVNGDNDALRKNAEEATSKNTMKQFEEADMVTGEEDEESVLKMSGKVFLFSNEREEWVEKGFCFVHVNDAIAGAKPRSRLVARSKGGLKVIINSFIWRDMVLTRASDRSLRISANSDDGVKSYLLTMLNSNDADTLYHELLKRKRADQSRLSVDNKRRHDCSSSEEDQQSDAKKRALSDTDE